MKMRKRTKERLPLIYQWIAEYIKYYERPPTVRELAMTIYASSTSHASKLLAHMEGANMIERTPNVSRGLKLLPPEGWTL